MVSAVMIFSLNVMFTFFVDNITLFFMYSLGDLSQSTVFCQVLPKLRGQLEAFPVQNYEKSSSLTKQQEKISCCSWLEFLCFGASFIQFLLRFIIIVYKVVSQGSYTKSSLWISREIFIFYNASKSIHAGLYL